jgi:hypothetical protein
MMKGTLNMINGRVDLKKFFITGCFNGGYRPKGFKGRTGNGAGAKLSKRSETAWQNPK